MVAVPHWREATGRKYAGQTGKRFHGRYKNWLMDVWELRDRSWYWRAYPRTGSRRIEEYGFEWDAGTASRKAERAAGYKATGEVLPAFQNPNERRDTPVHVRRHVRRK